MVFLTGLTFCVKTGARRYLRRKFLDSLRLHVTGGAGGMGLPKYGGIGGDGGSVCVIGKEGLTLKDTLRQAKEKRIKASNGENSHKNCIVAPRGNDNVIEVPVGISVFSEDGSKLGEINNDGDKVTVAQGGFGGMKETSFSGYKGESKTIILDLKLIADVGLVGFPNAGKSTLLSLLSNARPKIASYPFTTIHPNIGLIQYPDLRTLSVADLPGLIEGSHINSGMGHKFLKHVERTKVLLMVVDISGFKLGYKFKSRSCLETIILLNKELELYRDDLLDKPTVLVINKMDKRNALKIYNDLKLALDDYKAVISDVPAQLRPLRPLRFESILCMTAKEAKEDEINILKTTLREVLDASVKLDVQDELNLINQLDSSQTIKGPILV